MINPYAVRADGDRLLRLVEQLEGYAEAAPCVPGSSDESTWQGSVLGAVAGAIDATEDRLAWPPLASCRLQIAMHALEKREPAAFKAGLQKLHAQLRHVDEEALLIAYTAVKDGGKAALAKHAPLLADLQRFSPHQMVRRDAETLLQKAGKGRDAEGNRSDAWLHQIIRAPLEGAEGKTPWGVQRAVRQPASKQGEQGETFSKQLLLTDGEHILMTKSKYFGTYGKVRLAEWRGARWAVKDLRRTWPKPGVAPDGGPKSRKTPDFDALLEGRFLQRAHGEHMPVHHFISEEANYLVMPLLSGELGNLRSWLENRRGTSLPQDASQLFFAAAMPLTQQLADFQRSTDAAICDIKPANVMVHPTFGFRLMDFGLVAPRQSKPFMRGPTGRGTLGYFAPEHLLKSPVGLNTDVWSLGQTLAEFVLPAHLNAFSDPDWEQKDFVATMQSYQSWHLSQQRGADGMVDVARLTPPQSPFSLYFGGLAQLDPEIGHAFVNHIQHWSAAERFSSEEFKLWAAEVGRKRVGEGALQVNEILQQYHAARHG